MIIEFLFIHTINAINGTNINGHQNQFLLVTPHRGDPISQPKYWLGRDIWHMECFCCRHHRHQQHQVLNDEVKRLHDDNVVSMCFLCRDKIFSVMIGDYGYSTYFELMFLASQFHVSQFHVVQQIQVWRNTSVQKKFYSDVINPKKIRRKEKRRRKTHPLELFKLHNSLTL